MNLESLYKSVTTREAVLECEREERPTPHALSGFSIVETEYPVSTKRKERAIGIVFKCQECGALRVWGILPLGKQIRREKGGGWSGVQGTKEGREARKVGISL